VWGRTPGPSPGRAGASRGDIASNRRDEQELSVLCLRVLRSALVYVNTLMVQDVLADDKWADRMTPSRSARSDPAVWTHVAPYG
jgi:hypothetical protein